MGSGIRLGKLFGIEFRLHFTWFIIFVLVTITWVQPYYSQWFYWVIGIVASLLLFGSVLAHELAHSLVGRANGIPVVSITLFIFGGVSLMTKEAARPGAELKMAVAGPLCSLVLGAAFGSLLFVPGIPEPVSVSIERLAVTNGILAVFNLVPGFPLDGGRVFRSTLWYLTGNYKRASLIAVRVGQGIGFLLMLGGILIIFLRPFDLTPFDGIWMAFIGWFLESTASASYRQARIQKALARTVGPIAFRTSDISPDTDVK